MSLASGPSLASPSPLRHTLARVLPLAWPVLVGQLAVMAFGTVDTVLAGRTSTHDLAALGIGVAVYIAAFVGLMGVVLAIGPIAGQAFGAKRMQDAGHAAHQAVWVALGCAVVGSVVLFFPQPLLAVAQAEPEVAWRVRAYLSMLALALPAALLFAVFRGFNTAVSRPKAVMVLQLSGLALKVPLAWLLVFGAGPVPAMGVMGCGLSSAIVMWCQLIMAVWVMRRDPFYHAFELHRPGEWLRAPDWRAIRSMLKLGLPMGGAFLLEVTGFAFMAIFVSRLGATPVAGHQVAVNLVSMMFMVPLALSNAVSTLVAQQVGAKHIADARRLGWHGMVIVTVVCATLALAVFLLRSPIASAYSNQAAVVAAALPLIAWLSVFHVFDGIQTMAAFVLRSWKIATLPMFIYAISLWGIGLGGGWLMVFTDWGAGLPVWLRSAQGYWVASTAGLVFASIALTWLLAVGLPANDQHDGS